MKPQLVEIGDAQNFKMIRLLNEAIVSGFGYIKINVQDHKILDMEQNIRSRSEGITQDERGVPFGLQI